MALTLKKGEGRWCAELPTEGLCSSVTRAYLGALGGLEMHDPHNHATRVATDGPRHPQHLARVAEVAADAAVWVAGQHQLLHLHQPPSWWE